MPHKDPTERKNYLKQWKASHRESRQIYNRGDAWRHAHPELAAMIQDELKALSRTKRSISNRRCKQKHREANNKRLRDYYRRNPGRKSRYDSAYRHNHTERVTWKLMIRRCCDQTDPGYRRYGGRGIKICERWLYSFANFLADMGKKPSRSHSIDRINNDGNYEPDNCRWATPSEQASNRRMCIRVTIGDTTDCLTGWCRRLGFTPQKVLDARRKGKLLLRPSGYTIESLKKCLESVA